MAQEVSLESLKPPSSLAQAVSSHVKPLLFRGESSVLSMAVPTHSYRFSLSIPRTEQVKQRALGRITTHTVFCLHMQLRRQDKTTEWVLKKRYSYFHNLQQLAEEYATKARRTNTLALQLPKRKLVGHRDPQYVNNLRIQLEEYLRSVVELIQSSYSSGMTSNPGVAASQIPLDALLTQLELPLAEETSAWEGTAELQDLVTAPLLGSHTHSTIDIRNEGIMWKQGGSKSGRAMSWRRRWFLLCGSSLHYYMGDDLKSHKGTLELADALVIAAPHEEQAFALRLSLKRTTGAGRREVWRLKARLFRRAG